MILPKQIQYILLMIQIENKYLHGVPTPDQLQQLKKEMDTATDDQLAEQMEQRWKNDDIDVSNVSTKTLDHIYSEITKRLDFDDREDIDTKTSPSIGRRLLNVVQWAAVFLLPITIALYIYMRSENAILANQTTVFTTNNGQQGGLTLPDGTEVNLNELSKLSFQSGEFSGKERNINFQGEAFFKVAKDPTHPFIIRSQDIEVKVLGTKFNLMSRTGDSIVTLALVEGTVRFANLHNQQSIVLKAGQQLVYNKLNHRVSVNTLENSSDAAPWQRKEIVFRSETLRNVLDRLANNYHMKVIVTKGVPLNERFTGVMSSCNLNENLKILELSNQLQTQIKGKTIYVSTK